MISISTDSHIYASVLIGLASIYEHSDSDLPGRDKLTALIRLLSEFASGTESWKETVRWQFQIEDQETLDEDMIWKLNTLRKQVQFLDKALEDILSDQIS